MQIHILGICGKFMAGLAVIAKEMGHNVSGSDNNITGPLADMLRSYNITLLQGYEADSLPKNIECVIVGNVLRRGMPIIERILNENIHYYSGPQWLHEQVLRDRWVVAVAGTHGKTTTTSMLAWILEEAGYEPGFLIGGNPCNFNTSARYTNSNFFVIEADEYDTAFFDKRSKFLHYNPKTLIINNLEYDHADIFEDLNAIKRQFWHLLRILPNHGLLIAPSADQNVKAVIEEGLWSPLLQFGSSSDALYAEKQLSDCSEFTVFLERKKVGTVRWSLLGEHNMYNALAALAAARHVGISPELAINALNSFQGVKRRLEIRGKVKDITIYDDFAHHPTAIATTLNGLRERVGAERIFAVLEFASNTMRAGYHEKEIGKCLEKADSILLLKPASDWSLQEIIKSFKQPVKIYDDVVSIVEHLATVCQGGDHIVCMSNHHFDNIHEKLLARFSN